MKKFLLSILVLLALAGVAEAQTPPVVNPKTISWTAPTTNADGTPLTDLGSYSIEVAPQTGAACPVATDPAYVSKVTPLSVTLAPAPNTTVTVGSAAAQIHQALAATDGNYCVRVRAVDTALNASAPSVSVPFNANRVAPAAVTGVSFGP